MGICAGTADTCMMADGSTLYPRNVQADYEGDCALSPLNIKSLGFGKYKNKNNDFDEAASLFPTDFAMDGLLDNDHYVVIFDGDMPDTGVEKVCKITQVYGDVDFRDAKVEFKNDHKMARNEWKADRKARKEMEKEKREQEKEDQENEDQDGADR